MNPALVQPNTNPTITSNITPNVTPYVGPRTFREAEGNLFFGREREARDLTARIVSERLLLFYAQSGAGKSSLLHTRIIPWLRDEEGFQVLPVGRVSGELPAGVDAAANIFAFNLMISLDQSEERPVRLAQLRLSEFLARLAGEIVVGADGQRRRRWVYKPSAVVASPADGASPPAKFEPRFVLIIDQFEEIISSHPSRWRERAEFFHQLDQAMSADPALWVVLTLREDYVAALDPYAQYMADRLRARFYMERMGVEAALDAIKKPAELGGRPFAPGVAEDLVDNLRRIKVLGQADDQLGQYVEPVQLQVVCYQLWKSLQEDGRAVVGAPGDSEQAEGAERAEGSEAERNQVSNSLITETDLKQLARGGNLAQFVDQALADYYEQALQVVLTAPELALTENQLRTWFSTQLITKARTRGFVLQETETTAGLPNAAMHLLQKQFLVRAETRAGGVWYELIHDRFVEPIQEANRAWFARNQNPLTQAAQEWFAAGQPDARLYRDRQLAEAAAELELNRSQYGEHERAFVRAGQMAEQRRKARRQRLLLVAGALTLLILTGLTTWAVWNANVVNKLNLLIQAEQRITTGLRAVDGAPQRAVLLGVEGVNAQRSSNKSLTVSAENNFRDLLQQVGGIPLRAYEGAFTPMVYRSAALIVSPNGRWLASASFDPYGTVKSDPRIWLWTLDNPATPPRLLTGHATAVTALTFSPDSQWLASAGADTTIGLWAMEKPDTQPYTLTGHSKMVTAVSFSPDGRWLASASQDNSVRLWDVTNPRSSALILSEQEKGVNALLFSPHGRWLAVGKEDGTVQVWMMAELRVKPLVLNQHVRRVITIAFSPDERWLASGSADATIRLWDLTYLGAKSYTLTKHALPVWALAFSRDGRWLASGGRDRTVLLWDMMKPLAEPRILYGHEDYITTIAFSPDSRWLASASFDKTVRLWDVKNPTVLPKILRGHEGHAFGVVFSPDGRWLASVGRDQIVRLWEMSNLSVEPRLLSSHTAPVGQVTFSPDQRWLTSIDADGTTLLWATANWAEPRRLTGGKDAVTTLAFSPDGQTLAGAGVNGIVQLWSGTNLLEIHGLTGHTSTVTALVFSLDGQTLASADKNGTVRLWAMANLTQTHILTGNAAAVNMLAFSPDHHWLASAGMDNSVLLWDLTNLAAAPHRLAEFKKPVWSIAFSPDGQWLAGGSGDTTVGVWAMTNLTKPIILTGHTDDVGVVAFSPNGRWLATASWDWTVRLWSVENWLAKPKILAGHVSPILSATFSPDGRWLATAGFDRTVRRWDMTNLTTESLLLRGYFDAVNSVAFSADGRWLASASADKTVRLWTMPIDELIDKACSLTGRNLTRQEWMQYFGDEMYHQTCPQWPEGA